MKVSELTGAYVAIFARVDDDATDRELIETLFLPAAKAHIMGLTGMTAQEIHTNTASKNPAARRMFRIMTFTSLHCFRFVAYLVLNTSTELPMAMVSPCFRMHLVTRMPLTTVPMGVPQSTRMYLLPSRMMSQ